MYSFERRIYETSSTGTRHLFPQYMPGFYAHADFHFNSGNFYSAVMRKTEFKKGFKPTHLERIAGFVQIIYNILNILMHIMGKHKFIMQFSSPSHEIMFIWLVPEFYNQTAYQQHL